MREKKFITILITGFFLSAWALTANAEKNYTNFEEKARRSHELSMSDVVYQQEDFRALYYQNEAMIQLLKEIRDEMHALNLRDAKDKQ